jgi:hypothetical protein
MSIDDLSWHDGVLTGWRFAPNYNARPCVELDLWLYPEQIHSSERDQVLVRCNAARRFLAACDIGELKENAGAGNVVDGYRKGSLLRLLLTGGIIEVEAASFDVVQSTRRSRTKRGMQDAAAAPGLGRGAGSKSGRRTR